MKLFIFGSTGDLVRRKIIPAFRELKVKDLEIIALGRKDFTKETYEKFVCDDNCFDDFEREPQYHKADFGDTLICERCGEFLDAEEINYFYSAMPPKNIGLILSYLGKLKRDGYQIRALIEKPFGESLDDAKKLKKLVEEEDLLEEVYISDHYLFKDEILPIKPVDFKKLKIVSLEKVGLENRIGYYDDIGALKDMVQSHLLNIVFRFLKNPGGVFKKFEVVSFERGQYDGYTKELGRESDTETFARVVLNAEGKEIELITGKKFDSKIAYIEIDGKKIGLVSDKNAYSELFLNFFSDKREKFPTLDDAILAWKIIDKIESKKDKVSVYKNAISTVF